MNGFEPKKGNIEKAEIKPVEKSGGKKEHSNLILVDLINGNKISTRKVNIEFESNTEGE